MFNQKKYFFFVAPLLILCCLSCCKNQARVDALIKKVDSLNALIDVRRGEVKKQQQIYSSLGDQKQVVNTVAASLKDSADRVIQVSPIASAYIFVLDQTPYQYLSEYVHSLSTAERLLMLGTTAGLVYYGEHNMDVITMVRGQLHRLEDKKLECIQKLDDLYKAMKVAQATIASANEDIENLKSKKTDFSIELKALN